MGFLDKLKGAVNAVTGGAAKVTIQYNEHAVTGSSLAVKVTATSTGGEVKSKGIFVDLQGSEEINIPKRDHANLSEDLEHTSIHLEQEFQLCGEFVLAPNETKVIEGTIQIPAGLQPSFSGKFAHNNYAVRGRVEAKGADPDSGFQPLRVTVSA